ncbi:LysR family transcriptional regulator [Pseudomonas cannabina]|uniref:LysR family transcriptional regulator n=1 Tax=Pseudomonas syringae pv. maculicola str. ES4326 TaxID=629265 RepID=A0A8T8C212_PSEYM|nr:MULTISPECIES: LysR family transcriptional regulator [Pseudomonas syringae group]KPB71761.1 Regulatory protein [Pseudomonas syringae pv. maculicola]QHE97645.1 LysR family transcriptional regulator [Pseudomonas syringae pv. maculicola str. ES4326]QQN24104.1 LysR family transcriptional regulator [Pseudomonas cannabina pv. alisalensis]UBY98320.1 LysR family transcriptional regulator [Pseudomonas cannabina pv. alisalensis]
MPINFDLNDLQAFRAVVETGSFRKAADTVQITQPALSRRIEKLESALNVKLFERTTRKVSLTTVGRAFLPQVERILDDLDSALMTISAVGSTRMGNVTIACVPSAAYYFMPQVISTFHQLFPKIRIKVLDASANEVNSAVALGEADFGVSFSGNLAPEVDFEELLQERYVMACRRDHPLALCDSVSWEEMYRHDYISLGITSGNRLASTRPLRDSICETRHVTTMIGLVEAGLGVAAVPSIAMPMTAHPFLVSVPLVAPEVIRNVGVIKRRGRTLTPAALELERLVRQMPSRSAGH